MADQTIEIEYLVKTNDAIQKAQQFVEQTNRAAEAVDILNNAVQAWAESSKRAYREAAEAAKQAYAEARMSGIAKPDKPDLGLMTDKASKAQAKAQYSQDMEVFKALMADAKKDIMDYNKAVQRGLEDQLKKLQDIAKLEKETRSTVSWASSKSMYGRSDELQILSIWRKEVEATKQKMLELKQATSATFSEIANVMKSTKARDLVFKDETGTGIKTFRPFEEYKKQYNDYSKIVQQATKELDAQSKKSTGSLKNLDGEMRQKPKDAGAMSNAFKALGSVGSFVFGTVLGISAVQILRDLIGWFRDAAKGGVEFAQSLYKLSVSVHAMQRVGMDVTMRETAELVKRLGDEFEFFTTRQIVDGVAYVQLLTRNFGFTKEQMQDVFKIATTLSVVLGKDFNEAARETALFLSSGYAESMQRAGLAVNRLTVTQEAHRMGIKKSYMAMTEQERAGAALNLVLKEMGPLFDDVAKYADTAAGKIKISQSNIQETRDLIGLQLVPVLEKWYDFWEGVLKVYVDTVNTISGISKTLAEFFILPFKLAEEAQKKWEQGMSYTGSIMDNAVKATKEATKDWFSLDEIDLEEFLGENAAADAKKKQQEEDLAEYEKMVGYIKKVLQERRKAEEDYLNDRNDIINEYDADMQEMDERHQEEMAKIDAEGNEKRLELAEDFKRKMEEIELDMQREIEDENREYQRDLQDAALDEQQQLKEANRQYREEELKAERDYQDKLRRLREEYLFDLEDALRERDALQVLRLMRRYQMDKNNLEQEKKNDDQERAENYRNELADIREQAARKRAELAREHARRLEDIRIQAERERADALAAYAVAQADLAAELQKERDALLASYEAEQKDREAAKIQELADLDKRFEDRLTEIITSLAEEEGMTNAMLDKIVTAYEAAIGKDGAVDKTYDYLIAVTEYASDVAQRNLREINEVVNEAVMAAEKAEEALQRTLDARKRLEEMGGVADSGETSEKGTTDSKKKKKKGKALGGIEYANKPTWALFGEAGPEIANFVPLSRLNTNNLGLPNPFYGGGGGGPDASGKIRIELAPGLIATIIDGALDQVADIYQGK